MLLIIASNILASHNTIEIVQQLFPRAAITSVHRYMGYKKNAKILSPITLRGKKGFIPLQEIMSAPLNDSIINISFMIYIAASQESAEEMLARKRLDVEQQILLQSIFWNTKNNEFIGKPQGFPLKGSQWTCYGDVCDIVKIFSVDTMNGIVDACSITYTTGLDRRLMKILVLKKDTIYQSESLPVGEYMDWSTDTERNITYRDFALVNDTIKVKRVTQTDDGINEKDITSRLK